MANGIGRRILQQTNQPQGTTLPPGVAQPFTFRFGDREARFSSFEEFKRALLEQGVDALGPAKLRGIKEFEAFTAHLKNTIRIGQQQQTERAQRVQSQVKEATAARRRAARAFSRTQTLLAGTGASVPSHFLARPSILSGGGS